MAVAERNMDGEHLIDFAVRNDMAIMNTFFEHDENKKWTWYRWSADEQRYTEKSMIDMIMINDKRMFEDVKSIPTVSLDSDHRMVLGKITWKRRIKPRKKIKERYCLERLREEGVMETFDEGITRRYEELADQTSAEESWKTFKAGMDSTAKEVLGKKRVMGGKRKKTAWWNEEVKNAVKIKNRKYRKWMKTRTEGNRMEYINARNHAEEVKRTSKDLTWRKIGVELREDLRGAKKLIYGMAKNM